MTLTHEAKEQLRQFITRREPFGPIDASRLPRNDVGRLLFDKHNVIYRHLLQSSAIIVGRRGAGKTAFLSCLRASGNYQVVAELKAHSTFEQVVKVLQSLVGNHVYVETVAEIWEVLFWCVLFRKFAVLDAVNPDAREAVCAYLDTLGVTLNLRSDDTMVRTMNAIAEATEKSGHPSDGLRRVLNLGPTFDAARAAMRTELGRGKLRAVVLMDSVEDYKLDSETHRGALEGLLKCLGQFNLPDSRAEIRLCLPAELYHAIYDLSSNPEKDFHSRLPLHWHASELIRLAAHRLELYLTLYCPRQRDELGTLNMDERDDVNRLFGSVFPAHFTNWGGGAELPLAYVLRHTQLLPRHFLEYLNEIWAQDESRGRDSERISAEAIREGVYRKERDVCSGIFSGYRHVHPAAKKACELTIPELPSLAFTEGDLRKVFNQFGKSAGIAYFEDYQTMMVEIGAIGRVTGGGDADRYIRGEFEYTVPGRLAISREDTMCLHPVFSKSFIGRRARGPKPVYPYGCDVSDSDNRRFGAQFNAPPR